MLDHFGLVREYHIAAAKPAANLPTMGDGTNTIL